MKLLEKILLGNDFSQSSENVVAAAIELASTFNSKVIPMHVLPDDVMSEKVKSLLNEAATMKLEETAERIKSEGIAVEKSILEYGSPHDCIVDAAVGENANLILIGSGAGLGKEKFQLGTTAERIIQRSEKPVFVVKEGKLLNIQNILCPVDFSDTSKQALKNAITFAHRFKATLIILGVCELHVSTWFTSENDREEENKKKCAQHKAEFEKFLEGFTLSDLDWAKEIREGKPTEEILSAIDEKKVDLLIMGTLGKTGLGRLLIGSVTKKVVREVPCSFVTMKSEDIIQLQLENDFRDIEKHYKTAIALTEDGFYEEAIGQLKVCLSISYLHVPAYFDLAKIYEKLNEPLKAKFYRESGREIMDKMLDAKIEDEARRY